MTSADVPADLLVLGGGPPGLAAAWKAAQRGMSVTLLERAPHVGGMSASIEVSGVRVDLGSHRLHPSTSPRVMHDIRALLGDDLQLRHRNGRLRLGDKWVGFPLRAGEMLRALPPGLAAGIARDALTSPLRRARVDTYEAHVRAGLGSAVYDEMYGPFATKLWGLPGEEIHADQARVRVTADSPAKFAARLLRGGRAVAGTAQGTVFHYPRRGFGQIAEAISDAARREGATLRLGVTAMSLDPSSSGVVAHLSDGGTVRARRCFSTIPLTALAELTGRQVPGGSGLAFRAMILVYLVHGARPWTPYDAHYLPQAHTPVTRISEPTNYRVSDEDPADRTVICAEIPCSADTTDRAAGDPGREAADSVWSWPDEELAAVVEQTLADTGLPQVRRVGLRVVRLRSVYPIFDLDYARRLAAMHQRTADIPSVLSFGRLGLFAHDNSHHAMAEAYDAVDCLGPDGSFDEHAWREALRRFAGHRAED